MRATCRRAAVAWLAAASSLIASRDLAEELPRADAALELLDSAAARARVEELLPPATARLESLAAGRGAAP